MAQTRAQTARKRSMRKMYRKRFSACRGLALKKCSSASGCKPTKRGKRASYCRKSYSRRRRSSSK